MEAIFSLVSSSQWTPGVPRLPSHGMVCSGVTIRSRVTSWSVRGIRSGSTTCISWTVVASTVVGPTNPASHARAYPKSLNPFPLSYRAPVVSTETHPVITRSTGCISSTRTVRADRVAPC